MKNRASLFAAPLLALALLPGAAMAHTGHSHAAKSAATHKASLVCPVTGDKIPSKAKAVGHSSYKGKTYYFCCSECKPKFDKAPAKYVANAAKGKFEKM